MAGSSRLRLVCPPAVLKILHLTNLYPPYATGVPERQCRLVVNELANRGHFNRVLTSDYTVAGTPDRERFAGRVLRLATGSGDLAFWRLLRNERHNLRALRSELDAIVTDVVLVWTLSGLSNPLLWELERRGVPTVFAVLDHWPRHRFREDPWFRWWTSATRLRERLLRRLLRTLLLDRPILRRLPVRPPTDLAFRNAFFASRALRDSVRAAGFATDGAEVIPHCVGRDEIPGNPQRRDDLRRILWVGRLDSERDPMTAIQAIQELRHNGTMQYSLDLFGRGDVAFESRLHDYVRNAQLGGAVTIRHANTEELASLFPTYDLFLHTARYPEPFPLVLLRAMAARTPVVTTLEGGAADIVRDGENATVFRTGNPADCAAKLLEVVADREGIERRTALAYREVLDDYSALVVAGRIERLLIDATRFREPW